MRLVPSTVDPEQAMRQLDETTTIVSNTLFIGIASDYETLLQPYERGESRIRRPLSLNRITRARRTSPAPSDGRAATASSSCRCSSVSLISMTCPMSHETVGDNLQSTSTALH